MAQCPVSKAQLLVRAITLLALMPLALRAQESKAISQWDIQTTPNAVKIMRDAAIRFEQANPGHKVEQSHILNDAYKTKLKIAFSAHEPPCVFISRGGEALREYVKSNQVLDLTPLLAKGSGFRERFMSAGFNLVTFDGKQYGVPGENIAVAVMLYNKEIFAKYELTPPKTWDELMNVVAVLKANHIAPLALANKNKWPGSMYYAYLVDRIGGSSVFQKAVDRAPGGSFTAPAFIEAGKRIQDLVKAGAFAQGYNGLDYEVGASRRLLYSGRAAMELMGSWEIATIQRENPKFYEKLDFFAFPAVPGGKGNPNTVVGTVGDNFFSVSSACKDPDAAFRLIQFLTDYTSALARLDDMRIIPVKGLKASAPYLNRIMDLVVQVPNVQHWYDQELSPTMAELHKDITQAIFGLSLSPEVAAQQMEDAAKAELRYRSLPVVHRWRFGG
ncbi:extracellular solute-binding protein [Undibacterium sp. Di26W]|uniref:extracellular solute-binding protein n=1 Tax=Undibacterium sp. Di26W TaxID=3413035 RepID=UPI003BF03AD3